MEFIPKTLQGLVAHTVKCCSDKPDFVQSSLLPSDCEGGLGQNFPLFFIFCESPHLRCLLAKIKVMSLQWVS